MATILGVTVKAIIQRDDGKILLLQRNSTTGFYPNVWEFPGGKLDFGEEMEEAVIREVREESNLTVKVNELIYISPFLMDEETEFVVMCYYCEPISLDYEVKISREHQKFKWVEPEKLKDELAPAVLNDLEKYKVFDFLKTKL